MKIMDMLSTVAGIGLISMAATMAVADAQADVFCPSKTLTINGQGFLLAAKWCPPGTQCGAHVTFTDEGFVASVIRACIANAPAPGIIA